MIHPTYTTLLAMISEKFPEKRHVSMLDFGSGSGYLIDLIGEKNLGAYEGYDISAASIAQAKKLHPRWARQFQFQKNGKFASLGKGKHIDVMIMIGVVQYMRSDQLESVLNQVKKRLTPDGVVLMSCSVDRAVYRYTNLVQFFSPHYLVSRQELTKTLKKVGYTLHRQFERGILLSPICSQLMGAFDLIDRVMFSTRGTIGPVGNLAREITNTVLTVEYRLPVDFGYTLFIEAGVQKRAKRK